MQLLLEHHRAHLLANGRRRAERADNLAAYKARCQARPAFERALAAQLAGFGDCQAA